MNKPAPPAKPEQPAPSVRPDGANPDLELARDGARIAWRSFVKGFAAVALAITFAIKGLVCGPEAPEGMRFKYWGNHCGPGHGEGGEAIDELDEACRRHDAAVP